MIINNANRLAEEGGKSYAEAKNNAKFFQIIEIAGMDGRDGELNLITFDAKLLTDSPPIDMRELSVSFGEKNFRSILKYRSYGAPIENSNDGYNTWATQEFDALTYTETALNLIIFPVDETNPFTLPTDLDGDGSATDTVEVCDNNGPCPAQYDGTHLRFVLSGETDIYYAELRNQDASLINIAPGGQTLDVLRSPITGGWGYVTITGLTSLPYDIDNGCVFLLIDQGYLIDADLDDDGENDYLGLNATHYTIDLSSHTDILSYPLGVDLSSGSVTLDLQQHITNGQRYATMTMQGTTSGANTIDATVTVSLHPYHVGSGYFVAEHIIRAADSINGFMVPGDVVRFYVESYDPILIDHVIDVSIMYHDLETITKKGYVGNTFPNQERILIYPRI
jgi:hypothetical protein